MPTPSLLVILLHWNDADKTAACAERLDGWRQVEKEVIIIDNASELSEQEKLRQLLPKHTILYNRINGGFAGGNNVGIRYALEKGHSYVLLLNTDAEVAEESIKKMLAYLVEDSTLGVIGPLLQEGNALHYGGRDIAKHINTRIPKIKCIGKPISKWNAVCYVPGTVFLTRTALFREVGLLDETYFFSGEIADFCKSIWKKGHQCVIVSNLQAEHYTEKTASALRNTLYHYYNLRNRFIYIKKHYGVRQIYFYIKWWGIGLRQFVGALATGDFPKARAVRLALWHVFIGKKGNQNSYFL